jgi:hypothetical protein
VTTKLNPPAYPNLPVHFRTRPRLYTGRVTPAYYPAAPHVAGLFRQVLLAEVAQINVAAVVRLSLLSETAEVRVAAVARLTLLADRVATVKTPWRPNLRVHFPQKYPTRSMRGVYGYVPPPLPPYVPGKYTRPYPNLEVHYEPHPFSRTGRTLPGYVPQAPASVFPYMRPPRPVAFSKLGQLPRPSRALASGSHVILPQPWIFVVT